MTHDSRTAEPKPDGYYGQAREDLVGRLPRPVGRVLDLGCGEGGTAHALRRAGATAITGIEIHEPAAERARQVMDSVLVGGVDEMLPRLEGPFDTILLYDVLEHLVDPSTVLESLRGLAAPGAHLHVSVPNARHVTLVRDLVLRGTFGYTDAGHRDRTHLRWFTRRDLAAIVQSAGWEVLVVEHGGIRRTSRVLSRITRGFSAELLVYQWSLLARAGARVGSAAPLSVRGSFGNG